MQNRAIVVRFQGRGESRLIGRMRFRSAILIQITSVPLAAEILAIPGLLFCAAPIGAFFCPEIRAFTGFGGEISSTVSKVLSDRKALFKHKIGR